MKIGASSAVSAAGSCTDSCAMGWHTGQKLSEEPIRCVAFSPEGRSLAVNSDNTVDIYSLQDEVFVKQATLEAQHTEKVSGLDWSVTNKIISVSHDRNAFVWSFARDHWEPQLVELRAPRALNFVRWSPDGQKFAAASSAGQVIVSHWSERKANCGNASPVCSNELAFCKIPGTDHSFQFPA